MTTEVLKQQVVENGRQVFVLAGLLLIGTALLSHWVINDQGRLALAGTAILLLLTMAWVRPQWAIFSTIVYLVFVGDIRRMLIGLTSWSGQDPLLLVPAVVAGFLVVAGLAQRRIQADTPLSKMILVLMFVMVLQIMNPAQGGLAVGIGGALFYLVPLLWFWVGRTYATPEMLRQLFFVVLLPIAVAAAIYGIYQTLIGIPAYQQVWLDATGHVAMYIAGTPRAFSFFPSSIEHALFISLSIVALWAATLKGWRLAFLLIPLLFLSVFFVGSRGPIVGILLAMVVVWAVLGKTVSGWVPRLALAAVVAAVGLVWSLNQVQDMSIEGPAEGFVRHQTTGLLNPGESTAVDHVSMKVEGVIRGFMNPLGQGLGSTTIAAGKFGGRGGSTEMDISDMFVALGFVGGLLYVVIVLLVFRTAIRNWLVSRDLISLVAIGILTITFKGWLTGGRYAIAAIIWLVIGAMDRLSKNLKTD